MRSAIFLLYCATSSFKRPSSLAMDSSLLLPAPFPFLVEPPAAAALASEGLGLSIAARPGEISHAMQPLSLNYPQPSIGTNQCLDSNHVLLVLVKVRRWIKTWH